MVDELAVDKSKLGKAGEFIVASKLLLNDFKVYMETVDDGIDLVAKKNDSFYFFQVKTCQDIDYDSGKYIASLNIDTFSKYPELNTYLVLVLHYLGPSTSYDSIGKHSYYEQMVIPVPAKDLKLFLSRKSGKATLAIHLSFQSDSENMAWMSFNKRILVLDEYVANGFDLS